MNRRVMIFTGLLFLLVVTGGLTSFAAANGSGSLFPGVLTVTSRPEASVSQVSGNQGLLLIGWIAFVVFNLVGASLTGMAIFWFLNRQVERAKAEEPAQHERVADAFSLPGRAGNKSDDDGDDLELPATT